MAKIHAHLLAAGLSIAALPASAATLSGVVAISAGERHTCALMSTGGVKCWGSGANPGDGTQDTFIRAYPTDLLGYTVGVASVSAGGSASGEAYTCLTTTAGAVRCWGSNTHGKLGDGSFTGRLVPVEALGLGGGVLGLDTGQHTTCAVASGGAAKCWGYNAAGQLGDGTQERKNVPTDVIGLAGGVQSIGTAGSHACALLAGGAVTCWGMNASGQLGDNTNVNSRSVPGPAAFASGVAAIALSDFYNCALSAVSGAVSCWGTGNFPLFAPPIVGPWVPQTKRTPTLLIDGGIAAIAGGSSSSMCVLTTAGAVKCWGGAEFASAAEPTQVPGLENGVTAIAAGTSHACALMSDTTVKCWGSNYLGELGNGTYSQPVTTPVTVSGAVPQSIDFAALPSRERTASPLTLAATATSGLPVTYTSIRPEVCSASGSVVTLHFAGLCRIAADQAGNADFIKAPRIVRSFLVTDANAATPRLTNISSRGRVETGDDVMIAGFIIGGSSPKTVVVRARGPSLVSLDPLGLLGNPSIEIAPPAGSGIFFNNDWQTVGPGPSPLFFPSQEGLSPEVLQSIGFAPTHAMEAAVLATLPPGPWTAIVRGAPPGVGIVEVFEVDQLDNQLANIATRAKVQTGDDVLIAGFIIGGTTPKTVVLRGRGPSMASFGIANTLANPVLQLYSGQTVLATNDDWGTQANAAAIQATGLAPTHAQEAAMLVTLPPGAYTAVVSGAGGGTGVGIVEVFAQ